MKNKKVLFVSHLANFCKFNIPYMKWFQKQGWKVHYASLGEENVPYCDKSFTVCINRLPWSVDNIKAYRQLKAIIQREDYDIIHCHTPMGSVVARLAAISARKTGTSVIYTAHGFHFYKGAPLVNWLLYYPIEKWLSRFTDCLVTINDEDYSAAVKRHFHAARIVKIDGVGVNLDRFVPMDEEDKQKKRQEYGFDEKDFILVCVAEFTDNKDQMFLLRNIKSLCANHPNIKLLFAGKGKNYEACRQYVAEQNMQKQIVFLGYCRSVEKICGAADVLVSASHREGLAVNIMEGMACGLPIVCTDVRGQSDLVENGVNGFLYQMGDKEVFCNIIQRLYLDKNLRCKMKINNLNSVGKYSVEKAVSTMAKIYRQYM